MLKKNYWTYDCMAFSHNFCFLGSNLLLHRLFMEKGLQEELQFVSFDSETNLCPAIYVSKQSLFWGWVFRMNTNYYELFVNILLNPYLQ